MSSFIDVYCDFDGTITRGDTIDVLLDNLAAPEWKVIEDRWVQGEIGSRECMALQVPLIKGGWDAILSVLDHVQIDPSFPKFAAWCRQSGLPLRIVSDGIDRVIHHILKRENIHVDCVWANHLVEDRDGTLSLTFPHAPQAVSCGSGLCKCKILSAGSDRTMKVVIGDGRSDFCWSADADIVFAKSGLLQHCRASQIQCVPYDDFQAIRMVLEEQLVTVPSVQAIPQLA